MKWSNTTWRAYHNTIPDISNTQNIQWIGTAKIYMNHKNEVNKLLARYRKCDKRLREHCCCCFFTCNVHQPDAFTLHDWQCLASCQHIICHLVNAMLRSFTTVSCEWRWVFLWGASLFYCQLRVYASLTRSFNVCRVPVQHFAIHRKTFECECNIFFTIGHNLFHSLIYLMSVLWQPNDNLTGKFFERKNPDTN